MTDVLPMPVSDCPIAGRMLGRAFVDDPLWAEILTDPEHRIGQIELMFTALLRATLADGGLVEKTPGMEGVAVWHPPGTKLGFWSMVKSGFAMPRFVMALPGETRKRMMDALTQIAARREAVMAEPHMYLAALGVDPELQGQGWGSVLLERGLARVDDFAVYLETESQVNRDYYLHHGFEVIDEFTPLGMDVHLFLMVWGR